MIRKLTVCLMTVALVVLVISSAPSFDTSGFLWKTIDTEHFRIHFIRGNEKVASFLAGVLEKAHEEFTQELGLSGEWRTSVIIHNETDIAYGYANALTTKIDLSIVPPSEFDLHDTNYLESLARHEYAHIVNSHAVEVFPPHGLGRLIGWGVIPMWFIEGYAQLKEGGFDVSKQTALRSAFLSGSIMTLSDLQIFYYLNIQNRRLGYNLGHSLLIYLTRNFGQDFPKKVFSGVKHGNIDFYRVIKRVTGKSIKEIFGDWQRETMELVRKETADREDVEKISQPLFSEDGLFFEPLFSPDGMTLYFLSTEKKNYRKLSLFAVDAEKKKSRKLIRDVETGYCVSPDGRYIVYTKKVRARKGVLHDELFMVDLETGYRKRLTVREHATDPAFSPDGKFLVYTATAQGAKNLRLMRFPGNTSHPSTGSSSLRLQLTSFDFRNIVYSPSFTCDSRKIFFTLSREGNRDICSIDAISALEMFEKYEKEGKTGIEQANLEVKDEIATAGNELHPVFSGSSLYFIADWKGFLDLYRVDSKNMDLKNTVRLTHLKNGVLGFAVNSSTGAVVLATSTVRGALLSIAGELHEIERPVISEGYCNLTQDSSSFRKHNTALNEKDTNFSNPANPADTAHTGRGYSPVIRERFILPVFDTVADKGMAGVVTEFSDDLAHHRIRLDALGGINSTHRFVNLNYSYNKLLPSTGFNIFDRTRQIRRGQVEKKKGGNIFTSWKPKDNLRLNITLFNQEVHPDSISLLYLRRNPAVANSEQKDAGISLDFLYVNLEDTLDRAINPQGGGVYQFSYTKSLEIFEPVFDYSYGLADVRFFKAIGDTDRTAVLHLMGGSSKGDYDFQLGSLYNLRGYDSQPLVGKKMALTSFELRLPFFKGQKFVLSPFIIDRVFLAPFYDRGSAWTENRIWRESRGAELRLRALFLGKSPFVARIGWARRGDTDSTMSYGEVEFSF